MFGKSKYYKELKKFAYYKNAKIVGVVVPMIRNPKVDELYKRIIADNKKLVFLSKEGGRWKFVKAPATGFTVKKGCEVPIADPSYKETSPPDIMLIEYNSKNSTVYSFVNNLVDVPVIGFINKYKSEDAVISKANLMLSK